MIGAEVERWAENRTRILNENIELDRKFTALAEQIATADRSVLEMAEQESRQRASLAANR